MGYSPCKMRSRFFGRLPAVAVAAIVLVIAGPAVHNAWRQDSVGIRSVILMLENNAVGARSGSGNSRRHVMTSTVVVYVDLLSGDLTAELFQELLVQKMCPLTTLSESVALHVFSDHLNSKHLMNQAGHTRCPDSSVDLTLHVQIDIINEPKNPLAFWHEVTFDWYLKDAGLFLFTTTTTKNKWDLTDLADRCIHRGASVSPTGDLCVNASHYEAFGCLFPVAENPSLLFPSFTFNNGSHYENSYRVWIPWLVCTYGSRSLNEYMTNTNICGNTEGTDRLRGDMKRLDRWRAAERTQPVIQRSNRKIISMSLYGNSPKYTYGAFRNAVLSRIHFPDWTLRIYKRDDEAGERLLKKLVSLGVELIDVASDVSVPPMMWRFLVADDPDVDMFIVRDSDSRIGERDVVVVKEWMKSNSTFHCIRDHPSHSSYPVSGGIWGARRVPFSTVFNVTFASILKGTSNNYLADMILFGDVVWPKVKEKDAYCHDAYSCNKYPSSHPMPIARIGAEHLGQVFDRYDIPRAGDMEIITNTPVNKNCSP